MVTVMQTVHVWAWVETPGNVRWTLGPNQLFTKMIYEDLVFNLNVVSRVETTYPAVDWKKVWRNLSSNFIPTVWKITMYLVLNDVIPNNVKLKKHRIPRTQSPNCLECHVLDTNAHRSKRCMFSLLYWEWLKQRFNRNLNLNVDDPEEIFTRCSGRNGKAGLWLLLGVVVYNMKNYKAGSITEMTNGFRTLCTVFEFWSPRSFVFVFFLFSWVDLYKFI
jgi:hypothetical protein